MTLILESDKLEGDGNVKHINNKIMMRKKATYGKTMKAKSGKKLTAKAAKKRSVRNKAGKKAVAKSKKMGYGGKAASMVPPKSKMKKATYGKTMKAKKAQDGLKTPKPSQKGLKKLPTAVRNKMGYAKKGKTVKKAGYGTKAKKAKMGCSTRRKKK